MGYWRRLGVYRTLPLFFACGAALEWFMINVRIGKETFYETVVRLESERRLEDRKLAESYLKDTDSDGPKADEPK